MRAFFTVLLAFSTISANGWVTQPAWADSQATSRSFKENFEKVLDEDYAFMERQLQSLGERGEIELGNFQHLSLDQRIAVLSYTYSTFAPVNERLRKGGKAAAEIAPYVEMLNSALDLLEPCNCIVKRTVGSLPEAVLAEHQVGAIVTYAAYTSTSKERALSAYFNFTIRSRTGADLDGYASNRYEQEVLFKPGTRFRVTSRTIKGERYFFEMEEIQP